MDNDTRVAYSNPQRVYNAQTKRPHVTFLNPQQVLGVDMYLDVRLILVAFVASSSEELDQMKRGTHIATLYSPVGHCDRRYCQRVAGRN
jgi:hypothetical protein